MRKALHIIAFIIILGFLLYLVPPINQALKSQLLYSISSTTSISMSQFSGTITSGPCPQSSLLSCYFFGSLASDTRNFRVVSNEPGCSCQHLHKAVYSPLTVNGTVLPYSDDTLGCGYGCYGSTSITSTPTIYNENISSTSGTIPIPADNPFANLNTTSIATSPLIYSPPPESQPVVEDVYYPSSGFIADNSFDWDSWLNEFLATPTTTTSTPPAPVCGNGAKESGEQCDGPNYPCGSGYACSNCQCITTMTSAPTTPTPTTPPPTTPPTTPPPPTTTTTIITEEFPFCGDGIVGNTPNEICDDGALNGTAFSECTIDCQLRPPPDACPVCDAQLECPTDAGKDFDYGALASANPILNLPTDTEQATHFLSDDQFPSIWMGDSVDAPEGMANDSTAKDQDGLVFGKSNNQQITLKNINNVRQDYGTILVGRWEKLSGSYAFDLLSVLQVSQTGAALIRTDAGEVPISFTGKDPSVAMQDGWLTILYFDAEGKFDPSVPGSGQLAINGKPNFGYNSDQFTNWDGTNPSLDQIIYGGVRNAFDVSRAPGEVEDYLYCSKGSTGFRYYLPGDPQYSIDCAAPAPLPPPSVTCPIVPTTTPPPIPVCDFSNIQSVVCTPTPAPALTTVTTDPRSPITIIEELLNQYRNGTNRNTPEGRLRIIHAYLKTLLPTL